MSSGGAALKSFNQSFLGVLLQRFFYWGGGRRYEPSLFHSGGQGTPLLAPKLERAYNTKGCAFHVRWAKLSKIEMRARDLWPWLSTPLA